MGFRVFVVLCGFVAACGKADVDQSGVAAVGANERTESTATAELVPDLQAVARARVYFGHHSVGWNMLDGLQQLAAEKGVDGIHLVLLDAKPSPEPVPAGAFFAHSEVGENKDPQSKIDEFAETIREKLPVHPDVAFMKFCFVDFTPDTDTHDLFKQYQSTIKQLSDEYPDIRFLHPTVPLTASPMGIKDRVRRFLGMAVWEDDTNAKRHEFNELIRETYDKDSIIDVAGEESTRMDGTREQHSKDGQIYYSLVPEFTDDGGHLNGVGRKKVAAEMVRVIARNVDANGQ